MSYKFPTLLTDFYKTCHYEQYPKSMTKIVSYYTPRMSRVEDKQLVNFGLQYFIKEYLIKEFNQNFFNASIQDVRNQYKRILKNTLSSNMDDFDRWEKLYKLGYLPLRIREVPEGMRVPMGVPMIEITNTHDDFMWLVNFFETALSCTLWHMMCCANVGYKYRKIVEEYFSKTVDDSIPYHTAIGDFSMRGQESIESAVTSSAAFLLSFTKTATIPSILFMEDYYNADVEKETVGNGLASTEHSVMCSNYSIDGNEKDMMIRLLTEIYPNDNFTVVCDSYDYFSFLVNIMGDPDVVRAVMNHNGFVGIRGDSGDPIEIICGKSDYEVNTLPIEHKEDNTKNYNYHLCSPEDFAEQIGTVEFLFNKYGGYVNTKGYKVLTDKVRVVYGDSITPEREEQTYQRLERKRFASNNVILGMGSYSLQSCEGNTPMTRDTYAIAIKSTYGESTDLVGENKSFNIFKDPKTDTGKFKKSQKGCCVVFKDIDGCIKYQDGFSYKDTWAREDNLFETVFENGKIIKEYSLSEVRNNLHKGKF